MLQLSGNTVAADAIVSGSLMATRSISLAALRKGDDAIVERIDLPEEDARRLMELGFVPGAHITAGCSAPGGDPRVFQVDGSEIALRRETALKISVQVRNWHRG